MDYVLNELYPAERVKWMHRVSGQPIGQDEVKIGTRVCKFNHDDGPVLWGKVIEKDGSKIVVMWDRPPLLISLFSSGFPHGIVPYN